MRRICQLVVVILASGVASVLAVGWARRGASLPHQSPEAVRSGTTSVQTDVTKRAERECGRNSLYMFLRLHGYDVHYDDVKRNVEMEARGTSMLQLREGAARLGMRTTVYRCALDDLTYCPKPAIVHFPKGTYFRTPNGHYGVLLSANENGIDVLDGSFGFVDRYSLDKFREYWSGYILIPSQFPWETWAIVAPACLGIFVALWLSRRTVIRLIRIMIRIIPKRTSRLPNLPGTVECSGPL